MKNRIRHTRHRGAQRGTRCLLILLFLCTAASLSAQEECFDYEDDDKTIISGINTTGVAQITGDGELTIPAKVATVRSSAFEYVFSMYTMSEFTLTVEGDTEFELSDGKNALAAANQYLTAIKIGADASQRRDIMTIANITKLLEGLDNDGNLATIDIYDDAFPLDAQITSDAIDANTDGVSVRLPATRVGKFEEQTIGKATIYGRFTLTAGLDIITYCGKALFQDTDLGSHCLFYIADKVEEHDGKKMVHIKRVYDIQPEEGILIHNINNTADEVYLPRLDEENATFIPYADNMLRGTTEATAIGETETKDGVVYNNLILYNGLFYRTRGGTIAANKAYLQIRQDDLAGMSSVAMFKDDETTGNEELRIKNEQLTIDNSSAWYTLDGVRIDSQPTQNCKSATIGKAKGIYIYNGKKIIR